MRDVRTRVLVMVATLVMLVAACGDDANEPSNGAAAGGTSAAEETGGENPGPGNLYGGGEDDQAEETGADGAMGGAADVSVSLNNYLFDPDPVRVASGDDVEVRNANTRTPHTFTVVGEDVDLELGPMETETATIDLAPGTYDLICRFHESLGMTATLQVS